MEPEKYPEGVSSGGEGRGSVEVGEQGVVRADLILSITRRIFLPSSVQVTVSNFS